jgi:hypothetical protein
MQARDFCFWLQGYFEIAEETAQKPAPLTADQVDMIRRHLALVFKHEIDPSMGGEAHQTNLNKIHNQGKTIDTMVLRC